MTSSSPPRHMITVVGFFLLLLAAASGASAKTISKKPQKEETPPSSPPPSSPSPKDSSPTDKPAETPPPPPLPDAREEGAREKEDTREEGVRGKEGVREKEGAATCGCAQEAVLDALRELGRRVDALHEDSSRADVGLAATLTDLSAAVALNSRKLDTVAQVVSDIELTALETEQEVFNLDTRLTRMSESAAVTDERLQEDVVTLSADVTSINAALLAWRESIGNARAPSSGEKHKDKLLGEILAAQQNLSRLVATSDGGDALLGEVADGQRNLTRLVADAAVDVMETMAQTNAATNDMIAVAWLHQYDNFIARLENASAGVDAHMAAIETRLASLENATTHGDGDGGGGDVAHLLLAVLVEQNLTSAVVSDNTASLRDVGETLRAVAATTERANAAVGELADSLASHLGGVGDQVAQIDDALRDWKVPVLYQAIYELYGTVFQMNAQLSAGIDDAVRNTKRVAETAETLGDVADALAGHRREVGELVATLHESVAEYGDNATSAEQRLLAAARETQTMIADSQKAVKKSSKENMKAFVTAYVNETTSAAAAAEKLCAKEAQELTAADQLLERPDGIKEQIGTLSANSMDAVRAAAMRPHRSNGNASAYASVALEGALLLDALHNVNESVSGALASLADQLTSLKDDTGQISLAGTYTVAEVGTLVEKLDSLELLLMVKLNRLAHAVSSFNESTEAKIYSIVEGVAMLERLMGEQYAGVDRTLDALRLLSEKNALAIVSNVSMVRKEISSGVAVLRGDINASVAMVKDEISTSVAMVRDEIDSGIAVVTDDIGALANLTLRDISSVRRRMRSVDHLQRQVSTKEQALEGSLSALRADITDVRRNASSRDAAMRDVTAQQERADVSISELRQRDDALHQGAVVLREEAAESKREVERRLSEHEAAERLKERSIKDALKKHRKDLVHQLDDIRASQDETTSAVIGVMPRLEAAIDNVAGRINVTDGEVAALGRSVGGLQEELATHAELHARNHYAGQTVLEQLRRQQASDGARIGNQTDNLARRVGELDRASADANRRLADVADIVTDVVASIDNLTHNDDDNDVDSRLARLHADVETARLASEKSSFAHQEAHATLTNVRSTVKSLQNNLERTRGKIAFTTQLAQKSLARTDALETRANASTVDELRTRVATLEPLVAADGADVRRLEGALTATQGNASRLADDVRNVSAAVDATHGAISRMKRELDDSMTGVRFVHDGLLEQEEKMRRQSKLLTNATELFAHTETAMKHQVAQLYGRVDLTVKAQGEAIHKLYNYMRKTRRDVRVISREMTSARKNVTSALEEIQAEIDVVEHEVEPLAQNIEQRVRDIQKNYRQELAIITSDIRRSQDDYTGKLLQIQKLLSENRPAAGRERGKIVAFSARVAYKQMQLSSPTGTIVFHEVVTNYGDAYDRDTGKFTAPCDGLYNFDVTLMSSSGRSVEGGLRVGRKNVLLLFSGGNGHHGMGSNSIVVWMKRDEAASVTAYYGGVNYVYHLWTTFTGYLLDGFRCKAA